MKFAKYIKEKKSLDDKIKAKSSTDKVPYMHSIIYDIHDKVFTAKVSWDDTAGNIGTIKYKGKQRKVKKDKEYLGIINVYALMD